jgi:putative phosphoribosyl transferase
MDVFSDRRDAGIQLAELLVQHLSEHETTEEGTGLLTDVSVSRSVVLGLPRGGVVVAEMVAAALGATLDILVVRKLGLPGQPEVAMGAIGEDGVVVWHDAVAHLAGQRARDAVEQTERAELVRRVARWRGDRPAVPLHGRRVIIVDDGIATGSTSRAAIDVARAHGAGEIVLAVPVAPADTVAMLLEHADDVVCLRKPVYFDAVGRWYADFSAVTDDEVSDILRRAAT